MERQGFEKYIFAVLFVVSLLAVTYLSSTNTYWAVRTTVSNAGAEAQKSGQISVNEIVGSLENDVTTNVYERYSWIEAYGTVNRLLGKKETNGFDYAIDKRGTYNSVNFWNEIDDFDYRTTAQQLLMLKKDVEEQGGHFMFLLYPNKFDKRWNDGYEGVAYNDYNKKADELLLWLRYYGIDYLDFRETMADSGLAFDEMFYKTDHHWTGYAAFLSFRQLVDHLNDKYDAGLDKDGFYRDENNYEFSWVKNSFMGSQGRDVGLSFANSGLEDFQTVKTKFDVNVEYLGEKGSINDVLYKSEYLKYDTAYKSSLYNYYLKGVQDRDNIINEDNPDGPRMFFIRDSFSSPLLADMAPLCSELDASWGKYTSDRYVKNEVLPQKYDYVFVGYYTEELIDEFFKFYKDDVQEFKENYAKSLGITDDVAEEGN